MDVDTLRAIFRLGRDLGAATAGSWVSSHPQATGRPMPKERRGPGSTSGSTYPHQVPAKGHHIDPVDVFRLLHSCLDVAHQSPAHPLSPGVPGAGGGQFRQPGFVASIRKRVAWATKGPLVVISRCMAVS
jgi:hypothetical protein